ncbi:MAG: hypothetical protein HFF65_02360 [Oscillospiraceae bacterium]|mgnify:CR=1 FL=1|jgi:phage protein D|nr:hypothetical protein [Oscillospiraceae bacterium]
MKFSDLYQTYDAMREPNYVLKVGGKTLKIGDDARLIRVECQLTSTRQAGVLVLEAALDPKQEHGAAWLDAFQPGAMCSFSVGYGKSLTEVFCGFLYDVLWSDPLQGTILLLEAVFLDVRGRLMLTSCADAGAQRVMSQMIGDILGQSCCGELAKKKTIDPPPEDWDLPALRPGPSDYAILCAAADFLCYEFYAFADELYFGKPRPKTEAVLTFDGPNGLLELKRRRTLAGQCAAVAVGGTDDKGERLYSRQARKKDSGFGTDKMSSVLSDDFYQPEPFVRTMAQAQYLSKARMERRQQQSGGLTGYGVGLPELRPGRFIKAEDLSKPVNGTYYVHTVRHVLDETGYKTWFEAEE